MRQIADDGALDLTAALSKVRSREKDKAFEDLAFIIENFVYELTDIMVSDASVVGGHPVS